MMTDKKLLEKIATTGHFEGAKIKPRWGQSQVNAIWESDESLVLATLTNQIDRLEKQGKILKIYYEWYEVVDKSPEGTAKISRSMLLGGN